MQNTTCNARHATFTMQRAAGNVRHAPMQLATCTKQHGPSNMQRTLCNVHVANCQVATGCNLTGCNLVSCCTALQRMQPTATRCTDSASASGRAAASRGAGRARVGGDADQPYAERAAPGHRGPHRDSATSAPGLGHARTGTRPRPRRDSATSTPGLGASSAPVRAASRREKSACLPQRQGRAFHPFRPLARPRG